MVRETHLHTWHDSSLYQANSLYHTFLLVISCIALRRSNRCSLPSASSLYALGSETLKGHSLRSVIDLAMIASVLLVAVEWSCEACVITGQWFSVSLHRTVEQHHSPESPPWFGPTLTLTGLTPTWGPHRPIRVPRSCAAEQKSHIPTYRSHDFAGRAPSRPQQPTRNS